MLPILLLYCALIFSPVGGGSGGKRFKSLSIMVPDLQAQAIRKPADGDAAATVPASTSQQGQAGGGPQGHSGEGDHRGVDNGNSSSILDLSGPHTGARSATLLDGEAGSCFRSSSA